MKVKNRKMFQKYMTGLSELHGKDLSSVVIEMYWHALSKFSDEQCKAAFDKAIVKYKFFPKPAELIEDLQVPAQYIAQQQAAYLINEISGRGYRNPEDWKEDPTTRKLLAGRFDGERLHKDSLESDLKWIEKNFIEAYEECAEHVMLDEQLRIGATPEIKRLK